MRWVLTSHALDRNTLYTANRDISYYTVHESYVATIPLVFCEAEKMDPNTQFLKVMMIDEPAVLDRAIARIPAEVKEKVYRAEKCAVLP
ncbi:sugar phosphate phosphatase [Salmonella enterica subsp. enterica]|uniref:Sugar phosphate phosphatase n=1 Tax=Salmonella enterica I TaxID=59201 RepID=A0A447P3D0_SALET|nr:sugar phosphate phosphatase [Salmonella enterica subsp. enterica]